MAERKCLQCGEEQGTVRASQQRRDPIFCGSVDYFGETEWLADRHRFADWSDRELIEGWRIRPEFVSLYRRLRSAYEIDPAHRTPASPNSEGGQQ